MDLQTIRESVQQKKYHSREEFLADIKQVGLVSYVPSVSISVADPEPSMFLGLLYPDPLSTRYGSGSFCNQAKIVRKTLFPTVFL
jgi:hypothetical protein